MKQALELFLDHFDKLEDMREQPKILHSVREILLVTLCGVISGADGWEDIEEYGESKIELLQTILPFTNGIPSDDTLRRFFRAVNPEVFHDVFVGFVRELFPAACTGLVAIDGKTLRRSHDGAQKALHLVSAFGHRSAGGFGASCDSRKKQRDNRNPRATAPFRLTRHDSFH